MECIVAVWNGLRHKGHLLFWSFELLFLGACGVHNVVTWLKQGTQFEANHF